jgi:SPP1 gp7 family putative phage head morphogenesis protein
VALSPQAPTKTSRLDRLARAAQRAFRAAVEGALVATRAALDADSLAGALARRDPVRAAAAVPWDQVGEAVLTTAALAIEQPLVAGTARQTAVGAGVPVATARVAFGEVDPALGWVARTLTADLVSEVGEETRQALRETLARVLTDPTRGRLTPDDLLPLIGLTRRDALAVERLRAATLADGLEAGQPLAIATRRADRAAREASARYLRARATVIARTETIRAQSLARHVTWDRLQREGWLPLDVEVEWATAEDARVCELCDPLDGQQVPLGGKFPGGYPHPPRHPSCRCTTVLVRL